MGLPHPSPEVTERLLVHAGPASGEAGRPEVFDDEQLRIGKCDGVRVDRAGAEALAQLLQVKLRKESSTAGIVRPVQRETNSDLFFGGGVEAVLERFADQCVHQFDIVVVELVSLGRRTIHLAVAETPETELHLLLLPVLRYRLNSPSPPWLPPAKRSFIRSSSR